MREGHTGGAIALGAAARQVVDRAGPEPGVRIGYVMSRFPKLTETFVLYEMLAVEAAGAEVDVYPLLRQRERVVHPEAEALVGRANYAPFVSLAILGSVLRMLADRPGRLLRTVWEALWGTRTSLNFFVGAIGILPKTVHFARLMETRGVAHVHCHFASHPALAGRIIHRLTGIPYSFTAHGSDLHVDRTMLREKVADAAFVVAISEYNRRLIVEDCGHEVASRVGVIHCGVDTEVFTPVPDPRPSSRPFTMVCIGTLHEVKGQPVLLDAVARLRSDGVPVRCLMVGDGPDRRSLEARIRQLDLGSDVRLLGRLRRAEVVDVLRAADVLVAPSVPTRSGKREGIPVALMEGMSMGLPVVASRLSGIPELVTDRVAGLLVEPGDAAQLADALRRLRDDPAHRSRLGAAARRRVVEDFDLRRNADRLLASVGRGGAR